VVRGARLDVSALVEHPDLLLVTAALIVFHLVIHALAALVTRQPASAALIATAQLGVPAAVVQIGLQERVITPALGAAVTVAALATLAVCALGADLLARRGPLPAPPRAQRASPPPRVAPGCDRRDPAPATRRWSVNGRVQGNAVMSPGEATELQRPRYFPGDRVSRPGRWMRGR
jgi:hypothetical protein